MHFFGVFGTLMFLLGFGLFSYIGGAKLYAMLMGFSSKNIAEMSGFYIALTSMIIGAQLFLAGFLAEMISRNATDRNNYEIEQKNRHLMRITILSTLHTLIEEELLYLQSVLL